MRTLSGIILDREDSQALCFCWRQTFEWVLVLNHQTLVVDQRLCLKAGREPKVEALERTARGMFRFFAASRVRLLGSRPRVPVRWPKDRKIESAAPQNREG